MLFAVVVVPIQEALFGEGNGPIQYRKMRCNGSEPTLTKCTHSSYTASCDHSQDVGVICLANSEYSNNYDRTVLYCILMLYRSV